MWRWCDYGPQAGVSGGRGASVCRGAEGSRGGSRPILIASYRPCSGTVCRPRGNHVLIAGRRSISHQAGALGSLPSVDIGAELERRQCCRRRRRCCRRRRSQVTSSMHTFAAGPLVSTPTGQSPRTRTRPQFNQAAATFCLSLRQSHTPRTHNTTRSATTTASYQFHRV